MRQFFKFVGATVVGMFLFIILGIIFLVAIIPKPDGLKENSVLKIDLDKRIVEREKGDLFGSIKPAFTGEEGSIGLLEIRESVKRAKDDSNIKGIILDLRDVPAGFAMLEELRNTLIDFKKSGKFLIAYSESYSEGNYYLASIADKIYLPESGLVELNGLGVELLFFKGTLEKLEIKPEIFPVGKYKSAVEPFRYEQMSEANRVQIKSFLNSIYGRYLSDVSKARAIDENVLRQVSDSMLVRNSNDALRYKLVTDIGYYDQVLEFVKKKLSIEKDEDLHVIGLSKYNSSDFDKYQEKKDNQVAVIFATGEIEQGRADRNNIGSEAIAAEIRKARIDEDVKAIVLRINSPGGSALASDIIWREVLLASKVKPVIASMSDVAASGGYYIAAACDTIVAQPNTITGSIGVFGILFNGKDFLKNKLGITSDREATGKFSDIGSFSREMTDYERKAIQTEVERIYADFKKKVSMGRKLDTAAVEEVAQGRVWSGREAKKIGLVDILGGLDDAIKIAADCAKLGTDFSIVYLPEQKSPILKEFFDQMGEDAAVAHTDPEFEKLYPYFKMLAEIRKMQGIQTRMPFEIIVK
ncbi:MAG: signal peptide peptidase SppA [Cytophagaceae bacterium]|nr:signal peptide peptidase SppA [Cytophagaceae bacterium]